MKIKTLAVIAGIAGAGVVLGLYQRQAGLTRRAANLAPATGQPQVRLDPAPGALAASNESVPTSRSVPETVRPILGLSRETFPVRWAAIRALGTNLNQAERGALYDYLRGHEAETSGPTRGVLKNDVILALKNQQPPPKELAGVLLEMFYDKGQDSVIRNYALQHLGTSCEPSSEKARVLEALWAGTMDADAGIAGTALIGLSQLTRRADASQPAAGSGKAVESVSDIDRARLVTVASALASNSSGGDAARITALQVCAGLGVKDVLSTAVNLAESTVGVPLRISAVAVVGALGGTGEIRLLNRLVSADDPRIQTAARAALRRLEMRGNG